MNGGSARDTTRHRFMLAERARALTGSQTSGMRNRARKLRAEGVHIVNFAAGELDLRSDVGARARGTPPGPGRIIHNTPHTRTGIVYSAEVLEEIARLALQHDLTCVFDECYDELVHAPAVHHNIVKLAAEMKA